MNESTGGPERRRLLAVALGLPTTDDARRAMESLAGRADVVELRLDLMAEYDVARLLRDRPLGVVVTNRPIREGGRFVGDETQRARPLLEAVDLGAEYVDVEWDAPDLLADLARRRRAATRLIASSHDFAAMPPDLPERRRRLAESGADVAKVVGTARGILDNLLVFQALSEATSSTIAIAMGAPGLVSRVLVLRHDACLLTFASPDGESGTAPGQIPLASLLATYRAREIGSGTIPYGVVSLSPVDEETMARLNDLARGLGRDAVWVPLVARDAAEGARAARGLSAVGFAGYLVAPSARESFSAEGQPLRSDDYLCVRWCESRLEQISGGNVYETAARLIALA